MNGSGSSWPGTRPTPSQPVHAGCALLLVRDRPTAWLEISAVSDGRMAKVLHLALNDLLTARFGPATGAGDGSGGGTNGCVRAVHTPTADELLPFVPLLRAAAELAAETGARQAFEFLLGRQLDANPRQFTLTLRASPS